MSDSERTELAKIQSNLSALLQDERKLIELAKANGSLSKESKVTLGLCVSLLAAAFWLGVNVTSIQRDIAELRKNMGDRWTGTHQTVWASRLSLRNPTVNVPDVSEVKRDLQSN